MSISSIKQLLASADPLSEEALGFLVTYREEDPLIDYKEQFHGNEEKEWLEITKDIMAFSNTFGGYLLFGIRDASFDVLGLDKETIAVLSDVNNFQQKINRFLDPPVLQIRTKPFDHDGKGLVAILVPRLEGRTHVISRDAAFRYPGGEEKVVLRKGTIYVRRSGGNHLADARDIDELVGRCLEEFRGALFNKIARVVEAPSQSEVFILSSDPTDKTGKKFIIDDGPDSIPIKGMSFTVVPQTPEQEIAAWTAILSRTPDEVPPKSVLWQWYAARKSLRLTTAHKLSVTRFCLLSDVPIFYWIRGEVASIIKTMLNDFITRISPSTVESVVRVSAFFGKRFYETILNRVKDPKRYLGRRMLTFPQKGPRELFDEDLIQKIQDIRCKGSAENCRQHIEEELQKIASVVDGKKFLEPMPQDRWLAKIYDCFLYAQDDKYVVGSSEQNADSENPTI